MSENNFENNLKSLNDIVTRLENDTVSLDESISLFEKGMEYSKLCREALDNAELKIKTLTEQVNADEK